MLRRGFWVFGTLWSIPSGPMYRPDGRKSPACQVWSALRGVFPACEGGTSLASLPTGLLAPDRYAGTPPSTANAAGTRLSREIMVRKAPSFFIGTSPSRLYRVYVNLT